MPTIKHSRCLKGLNAKGYTHYVDNKFHTLILEIELSSAHDTAELYDKLFNDKRKRQVVTHKKFIEKR
jgi:hypothetical protein